MPDTLESLKPSNIWKYFSLLNAIPRASKKEEQVIAFMKEFGEHLGLETIVDDLGNVLIKKPSTSDKKDSPTIIMQGHLDMVHQKNDSTDFDFDTQGIDMYIDDDYVRARGTTLGADNGIGVAAIMSVLASDDMSHPELEAIFTIDEEVGMTGAMGLKKGFLRGDILLNLDSEEDHVLTVGSAGGVDVAIEGSCEMMEVEECMFFELSVEGLSGGHSGVDIHKGLCNAIKVLTRVLFEINKDFSVRISTLHGGDLMNAIPRECHATFAVNKSDASQVEQEFSQWNTRLKVENNFSDPHLNIQVKQIYSAQKVLSQSAQKQILSSLYTCPNGIYRMTPSMNNLVQSSNNLAKIRLGDGQFSIGCHTRSFIESERDDLVNVIRHSFAHGDAIVKEVGPYPGWNPDPNTKTVATLKRVYESLYGNPPEIFAIHAGLECGIFAETYPHLEIISFDQILLALTLQMKHCRLVLLKNFGIT